MQNKIFYSDEELFQCIKNGDVHALKILFEKYYSPLCHFAFKFVKSKDYAEEVVSDVFLNIWLKKEKIQIRTNLKTYLYTAVRNQSINHLRQRDIYFEDIETADSENAISDLYADKHMTYQELEDNIEDLLKQLPEKRQIIFRMYRVDGLNYKEIAEILSISVHTVQNQMVAAVKFLSRQYPHRK